MTYTYERWDSCRAEVTSRCERGVFLTLDNGESAFASKFGNLKAGAKVLCSIITPSEGTKRAKVIIESVYEYAA